MTRIRQGGHPFATVVLRVTLITFLSFAISACRGPTGAQEAAPALLEGSPGPTAQSSGGIPPKPRRPVVIGGCRHLCASPAEAAAAFVEALDDGDSERIATFLESSLLLDAGDPLGDRWVRMWRAGQHAERAQEIVVFVETLAARFDTARKEGQLSAGPAVVAPEGDKFARVAVPLANGETLTLRLYRRGIEWLVAEIVR